MWVKCCFAEEIGRFFTWLALILKCFLTSLHWGPTLLCWWITHFLEQTCASSHDFVSSGALVWSGSLVWSTEVDGVHAGCASPVIPAAFKALLKIHEKQLPQEHLVTFGRSRGRQTETVWGQDCILPLWNNEHVEQTVVEDFMGGRVLTMVKTILDEHIYACWHFVRVSWWNFQRRP